MTDQALWPTWTAGRIVATVAMILLGFVGAFVGFFLTAIGTCGLEECVLDTSGAIAAVFMGTVVVGLPASMTFFIVSRRRRKPLWSWLGAAVWLIGGSSVVVVLSSAINNVTGLSLIGGLTVIAVALGWIRNKTVRRADIRPKPLAPSRGKM